MIITELIGALAVLLAAVECLKNGRGALKYSFLVVFLFLALRYNFGNDYSAYHSGFLEINKSLEIDFFDSGFHFEPGWVYLCRLFEPVGFFWMVAILAALNCYIYWRFITKYISRSYYWLAVFFYVFNPGLMLIHSSAMRQSLAIAIFLYSFDALVGKRLYLYVALICVAALFHTSALVLLPLVLLGCWNVKFTKLFATGVLVVFAALFLYGNFFIQALGSVVDDNMARYSEYEGTVKFNSGIGFAVNFCFLGLLLCFSIRQERIRAMIFSLGILQYMFIPLTMLLSQIARVGMYFEPMLYFSFCLVVADVKSKPLRRSLVSIFIIYILYGFLNFFNSDIFYKNFHEYKTIFSAYGIN